MYLFIWEPGAAHPQKSKDNNNKKLLFPILGYSPWKQAMTYENIYLTSLKERKCQCHLANYVGDVQ